MNLKYAIAIAAGLVLAGMRGGGSSIKLSPEQEAYVSQLHAFAQPKLRQFIYEVEKRTGWKVIIKSGYRTFAKQLQLYNENHQNGTPGGSYHNYGMAIDINLEKGGVLVKKASSNETWYNTGVPQIAEAMGIEWGGGGNFGDYHDPVHFDVRGLLRKEYGNNYNTDLLKQKAFSQFGTSWDNIQGNKLIL